jgi:hypothetical protein
MFRFFCFKKSVWSRKVSTVEGKVPAASRQRLFLFLLVPVPLFAVYRSELIFIIIII